MSLSQPSPPRLILSLAIPLMALLSLSGCGGGDAPAIKPGSASAETQARLDAIELQIRGLEKHAESLRGELSFRLDSIETSADTIRREFAALNETLGGDAIEAAAPAVKLAEPDIKIEAPERERSSAAARAAEGEETGSALGWFVRLALLLVIVTALVFIGRIFFGRWGPDEDGESFPSSSSSTTSLTRPPAEPADPDLEPSDPARDEP